MLRRTFFKWTAWLVVPHFVPRWLWAQTSPTRTGASAATLRAVARVVLPSSLGPAGLNAAVDQFSNWVREYRTGAEMSAGYGITRIRVVPADPSTGHPDHLRALETSAAARGGTFASLDAATQRALVEAALEAAGVDGIPRRPDGRHVATDLMSHFFFIAADGQDRLYNAAIMRESCRGLGSSGARPAPLA
ncbi:MAG: hypothetical protein IT178_19985 [Acidobacteria bacterium]|nr:hypothetical protein [Acidobacteriota bacterium]